LLYHRNFRNASTFLKIFLNRSHEYIAFLIGMLRGKPVAQPVKVSGLLRPLCLALRQKAHHLSSCHLGVGTLLHDFSAGPLSENAGDEAVLRTQIFFYAAGVLLGCQVQNHLPDSALRSRSCSAVPAVHSRPADLLPETSAPERIE